MKVRFVVSLAITASALTGCGSTETSNPPPAPTSTETSNPPPTPTSSAAPTSTSTSPPAPTTPPAPVAGIVSVVPAKDAKGVRKDANIVITFATAMDQAATQSAFQSPNIGQATFKWNAAGTVLTVDPVNDLEYATDFQDKLVAAKVYSFTLTDAAVDLAGTPLPATSSSFSTLRFIADKFFATPALTGSYSTTGPVSTPAGKGVFGGAIDSGPRLLTSFDLSPLPHDLLPEDILRATVGGIWQGNGDGDLKFRINSVYYGDSLTAAAYGMVAKRINNEYIADANEPESGTLKSVRADWRDRAVQGNRSQWRHQTFTGPGTVTVKLTPGDDNWCLFVGYLTP